MSTTPTREVARVWLRQNRVRVEAWHPVHGWLVRGWLVLAGSEGQRLRWRLVDYDHAEVEGSPFVGNYLAAENVLLDTTSELEE